jgi:guanylate kinase
LPGVSFEPNLYVVAAPSGGGKTSLVNALLRMDDRIRLSVSHTTRNPRPGEVDGVHYHFVDEEAFLGLIAEGAFLEHAQVFGNYYGTGSEVVQKQLEAGCDVVLDIDWQGAQQIRESFPDCCTVFILPPSLETLRARLARRAQDSEAVIKRRMREARAEISHWDEFEFLIINDEFEKAVTDLHSIVRKHRPHRENQQKRIESLLAELLGNR